MPGILPNGRAEVEKRLDKLLARIPVYIKTEGSDKWDQIFTDKIIAAAIVDRLTHKSYIVDMNALSYRIKATEEWIKERKMKQKSE